MSDSAPLPHGLYERLLDEELEDLLRAHPEVAHTLAKVDDETRSAAPGSTGRSSTNIPLPMTP